MTRRKPNVSLVTIRADNRAPLPSLFPILIFLIKLSYECERLASCALSAWVLYGPVLFHNRANRLAERNWFCPSAHVHVALSSMAFPSNMYYSPIELSPAKDGRPFGHNSKFSPIISARRSERESLELAATSSYSYYQSYQSSGPHHPIGTYRRFTQDLSHSRRASVAGELRLSSAVKYQLNAACQLSQRSLPTSPPGYGDYITCRSSLEFLTTTTTISSNSDTSESDRSVHFNFPNRPSVTDQWVNQGSSHHRHHIRYVRLITFGMSESSGEFSCTDGGKWIKRLSDHNASMGNKVKLILRMRGVGGQKLGPLDSPQSLWNSSVSCCTSRYSIPLLYTLSST